MCNMKRIAVIVALESEYALVGKALGGRPEMSLSLCGIGKVNAAVGATSLIERSKPDIIISTGVANLYTIQLAVRPIAYQEIKDILSVSLIDEIIAAFV